VVDFHEKTEDKKRKAEDRKTYEPAIQ
jgi:hypothetical protein